jgi:hypothetical protein
VGEVVPHRLGSQSSGGRTSTASKPEEILVKKIKLVAAAAALLVLGSVGGVNAVEASQGAVVVRGTQTPVGDGHSYTMSGDLIGDWYTTSFDELGFTPSGALRGAGTELFVGCFDANGNGACDSQDPTGTMTFNFTYTGRFDTTTEALLHGRCHHPVTGGTDGFAGASGVLNFHDDPVTGCSSYQGNLRL